MDFLVLQVSLAVAVTFFSPNCCTDRRKHLKVLIIRKTAKMILSNVLFSGRIRSSFHAFVTSAWLLGSLFSLILGILWPVGLVGTEARSRQMSYISYSVQFFDVPFSKRGVHQQYLLWFDHDWEWRPVTFKLIFNIRIVFKTGHNFITFINY